MKRLLVFLFGIFICAVAHADTETLEWYIDGNLYTTTTCESGGDVTLPTAPTKTGYNFDGWLEYIPIEYLESTGTQYIDTDVYFIRPNTKVIIKFEALQLLGDLCGVEQPHAFVVVLNNGYIWHSRFISGGNVHINLQTNTEYTLEIEQKDGFFYVTVDGDTTIFNNPTVLSPEKSFYLFADSTGNGNVRDISRNLKIYYAKIYENDILLRDFVPALDPSGVPCMYDKVTKQFFYNAGTGDFIAGPEI